MKTIHTKNLVIVAAITALCAVLASDYLPSVIVGGLVQVLNLYLLDRGTAWLLGLGDGPGSALVKLLVALRFALLMLFCAALLIALPLDPIGFAVGFSSILAAAIWHGLSATGAEAQA